MSKPASIDNIAFDTGVIAERERIMKILWDNDIVRRCGVTDKLVAFQSDGEHVVYVSELEGEN